MLFDHPIVFHPGYEAQFRKAGHQGVITIYHAASRDLFDKPDVERIFDVGWVGRAFFNIHSNRRRVLMDLAGRVRLNEWEKFHSFEEMADVYRRSKIVVNVARDDFPQDGNMRAFEAMAAGCLLINRIPTELTEIGFQDGVHFVGYTDPKLIASLVGQYLADETARRRFAEAAREKVLREHTYDCRVSALLEMIEKNAGKFLAPARGWSEDRVRLAYLDYYSAHMCFDHASKELRHLAGHNLSMAATGGIILARGWAGRLRNQIFSRIQRVSS
jgi:glycosyltransferase involved in cell wall biosynthesis